MASCELRGKTPHPGFGGFFLFNPQPAKVPVKFLKFDGGFRVNDFSTTAIGFSTPASHVSTVTCLVPALTCPVLRHDCLVLPVTCHVPHGTFAVPMNACLVPHPARGAAK